MVVQRTRILHHEHLLGDDEVAGVIVALQFVDVEDLKNDCGQ
jgi:hypothetical protein